MNEMTLLKMDRRQREAWLLANRATLMAVGLLWLGLIAVELLAGRTPIVLIALVPVIALVRLAFYRYYRTRTPRS